MVDELVGQAPVLAKGRVQPNHKLVASRQLPCKTTTQRNLRASLYTLERAEAVSHGELSNKHISFGSVQANKNQASTAPEGCRAGCQG